MKCEFVDIFPMKAGKAITCKLASHLTNLFKLGAATYLLIVLRERGICCFFLYPYVYMVSIKSDI